MNNGWLELESDPGLFTLLLEDFGVPGVQVEEIYDLQKAIDGPVYGFIFLFKWIEERRSRRKITHEEESFVTDPEVVNNMFFAQQVIPNSCATHALLSVLLNCDTKLKLGDVLTHLREFTRGMSTEDKGMAIGNMPDLARAHNSHARPEPRHLPEKQQGISTVRTREAFHFVSYVPINGHLFELDGLKPHPIDHGPWAEHEEWTEKFRHVITERLGIATGGEPYHDIRFNLMAVVPDRRQQYEHKLETLKTNRRIVLETLQKLLDSKMVKVTTPEVEVETPSVMTRQMKSKEAANNAANGKDAAQQPQQSYISLRTRTKQKAAAAAAAAASVSSTASSSRSNSPPSGVSTPRLPPALDSHNYAKSPILEGQDGIDIQPAVAQALEGVALPDHSDTELDANNGQDTVADQKTSLSNADGEKMEINQIQTQHLHTVKDNAVKIEISVSDEKEGCVTMPTTVAHTDVTKPLIIQTKFACMSPGPGSESTDTASEIGSAMNSPVCSTTASSQNSPSVMGIAKVKSSLQNMGAGHLLTAVTGGSGGNMMGFALKSEPLEANGGNESTKVFNIKSESSDKRSPPKQEKSSPSGMDAKTKFGCHQGFTPKDLLALLKNVENEISICENNLRDEVEKRKRYKIDDWRRTHNYDQFICTFLSMLAEQGQLAALVEQHMLIQRRQGVTVGRLHKNSRKTDKRKKAKTKRKK